jgi:protease I
MDLNGKRIAILATNGFEQAELETPRDRLIKSGATVDVVSLASGEIKGWDKKDWGRPVKVDKTLDEITAADYDAVVLPGGQINPDLLRVEPKALKFIKDIFDAKKVVAAICHAPWLLCHTTFNVKNVKPAISMTYCSARYLINDTLLDNFAHLPTSYLRIFS